MKTLACQHVGKVWTSPGGLSVTALKDIDLTVQQGEFVAILGPSGCGKSTLLELIAGLEPVSSGRIAFDGKPIAGPEPGVVMVFQDHSLFPWLSVRDNVGFGLSVKGVPRAERDARVDRLLERVRLTKFARHRPHQLSGGMKQRVAIARALVESPDFIMMDEPFAALDFQTRVLMQRFLLEVWLEFKPTIIFVTHHIDEAVLLADRMVVMSAGPGRIIEEIAIDLPRPRRMTEPGFNDYRARLTELLEREVMRAYAEDGAEIPVRMPPEVEAGERSRAAAGAALRGPVRPRRHARSALQRGRARAERPRRRDRGIPRRMRTARIGAGRWSISRACAPTARRCRHIADRRLPMRAAQGRSRAGADRPLDDGPVSHRRVRGDVLDYRPSRIDGRVPPRCCASRNAHGPCGLGETVAT